MRKATGSYRTYSITGKTAALLPEFCGGRPASGRTAAQIPALAMKDCPWAEHTDDDDDDDVMCKRPQGNLL